MGKIAAHSAYDMFSWYKYLIVNLVFSHLPFWCGNLFLITPFPDRCLLVPFHYDNEASLADKNVEQYLAENSVDGFQTARFL